MELVTESENKGEKSRDHLVKSWHLWAQDGEHYGNAI